MASKGMRRRGWLLGIASAAALAWGYAALGDDKPAAPKCETPLKPMELDPLVQGASRCGDCHSLGKPPESQELLPLCRCNERTFWEHNDKHQDAFTALADPRTVQMGKILNMDPQKNADCLGCHSMATINLKVSAVKPEYLQQGVSCLSCHGAYDNWIDVHGTANDAKRICWRSLSREEKQEKWGMTDLWNPATRTQVCSSCHIGDADPERHRFVTHAMYAAGHPPLPPFETAAFCNMLPRHWQLMNEKTPEMQAQDYRWDPKVLEQTKLSVLGEAAAFRASVNLLAEKAKQTQPDQGLDFALFDCSACHHDLKQPSWRQTAGYEGPPGRPGIRRWSPAGLDLCLWYAGGTDEGRKTLRDEFDAKMGALRSAFTNRPYGDAAQVTKAGQGLVTWADDKLLPGLTKPEGATTPFDLKASIALLKQLATDAADPAAGRRRISTAPVRPPGPSAPFTRT